MRHWLLYIICSSGIYIATAQNNMHFSQYMLNPSYLNPSWIGQQEQGQLFLQHSTKWLGYTTSFDGSGGNPNSQLFTLTVPVKNFIISSAGVNFSNDMLGGISNINLEIPISVPVRLKNGVLNVGVAPGVFTQSMNADFRYNDPGDSKIPVGGVIQSKPNLSAGLFYQARNNWFLGLGVINMIQPGVDYGLEIVNKQSLTTSIHGGLEMVVRDEIKIQPNFIVRSDFYSYSFDIGVNTSINEKIWAGLSYRDQEALVFMVGYGLMQNERLKVHYAFDLVTSNREAKSSTSHELILSYSLPELVIGGRKSIKTPRFTY